MPTLAAWPVGFCVAVAGAFAAWFAGAGHEPVIGLVLLAAAAAGCGAVSTVPGGLIVGVLCWASYTGFVRDRLGVLRIDAVAGRDFALIAGGAVLASVFGLAIRRYQAGRLARLWPDPAELVAWWGAVAPTAPPSPAANRSFGVPGSRRRRHIGENR